MQAEMKNKNESIEELLNNKKFIQDVTTLANFIEQFKKEYNLNTEEKRKFFMSVLAVLVNSNITNKEISNEKLQEILETTMKTLFTQEKVKENFTF